MNLDIGRTGVRVAQRVMGRNIPLSIDRFVLSSLRQVAEQKYSLLCVRPQVSKWNRPPWMKVVSSCDDLQVIFEK